MNYAYIRSLLLKGMIGCLIAAAGVAVVFVIMGEFNQAAERAIGVIVSAFAHVCVMYLTVMASDTQDKNPTITKFNEMILITIMVIASLSFLASSSAILTLIDIDMTKKIYITFLLVFTAIVYVRELMILPLKYQKALKYANANIAVVLLMLTTALLIVWTGLEMQGFAGRLFIAMTIISTTISLAIFIAYSQHVRKEQEAQMAEAARITQEQQALGAYQQQDQQSQFSSVAQQPSAYTSRGAYAGGSHNSSYVTLIVLLIILAFLGLPLLFGD